MRLWTSIGFLLCLPLVAAGQTAGQPPCRPPPQLARIVLPRTSRLVPIALPTGDDLDACRLALQQQRVCRLGQIVVIDIAHAVKRAGRCRRHPAGTTALALTPGAFEGPANILDRIRQLPGYGDRHQNYVLWSQFPQTHSSEVAEDGVQDCPLAWHNSLLHPENGQPIVQVAGLGLPHNPTDQVLEAVIDMWSVDDWSDAQWLSPEGARPLNILAHESEHAVCCYLEETNDDGRRHRSRLTSREAAHWSFYHNTLGQLMYGGHWQADGPGRFRSWPPLRGLRPLDLYLWGLIPASAVTPLQWLDTARDPCAPAPQLREQILTQCGAMPLDTTTRCSDDWTRCQQLFDFCLDPPFLFTDGRCLPLDDKLAFSPAGVGARGHLESIDIERLIADNGPRIPDDREAPKVLTQLFVLLVAGADGLRRVALERLERLRHRFAEHLYQLTGGRLRHRSSWDGRDELPVWQFDGDPLWAGGAALEGWEPAGPQQARVRDGQLQLAPDDSRSGIRHRGVALEAARFDLLQLALTAGPASADPVLQLGRLRLSTGTQVVEAEFPYPLDGRSHTVVVSLPPAPSSTAVYRELTLLPGAGALAIDRLALLPAAELIEDPALRGDSDGDRLLDAFDNCPRLANPRQLDSDGDGRGNACGDADRDGVVNALDNCPDVANRDQLDPDGDGRGEACTPSPAAQQGCRIAAPRPCCPGPLLLLLHLRRRRRR